MLEVDVVSYCPGAGRICFIGGVPRAVRVRPEIPAPARAILVVKAQFGSVIISFYMIVPDDPTKPR
jgi:hypothetical protein